MINFGLPFFKPPPGRPGEPPLFGCQRAFTIVELLVSLAVIGILLSLLLPAVQRVRETARRSQCLSQMKQVVLAVHHYEAAWNSFPQHDWDASFLVHILPEIEQAAILEKFNPYEAFDPLNPNTGRNGLAVLTVPLYQCPSDPSHVQGGTNYVGNFGYGYQQFDSANGVIVNHMKPLRFADVTDGMSQTALLSECVQGNREYAHRLSKIWRTPYALQEANQLPQFATLCRETANSGALPFSFRGGGWIESVPNAIYTHTLYPNDVSCMNAGSGTLGIFSAASLHSGGVNLVFCDGHASFIQTAIDLPVWRAIGTRHGGESVSEF